MDPVWSSLPPYSPPLSVPPVHHTLALPSIIKTAGGPSPHPSLYAFDEHFALCYDAFPKGRKHLLLIPLSSPRTFEEMSASDLRLMSAIARLVCSQLRTSSDAIRPLAGFHAAPSLEPAHLHILPHGLVEGSRVKTVRHVVSFNSDFLVGVDDILTFIETGLGRGERVTVRMGAAKQ
eukprot:CAMPEP_0182476158 /NCGR_PEP_ID=MMETSP1319-20130603/28578_1 /TAXON_ID=172717 /ORGANISM="Bolidomonas pacifica, Strain RCC208" /LENGTH=176 /DNA_ID=CAMNT_0024677223 /DNA_START=152 /DNA_END=679 /DNA_ORIENTATION=+